MDKYGLLGEKLGHSYSPEIHARLADYEYSFYEVPRDELGRFLTGTDLSGMNVTIPHKKAVIPYCTELSDVAGRMGAVNLLLRCPDGWHGFNTDYYGFCALQRKSGIEVAGRKVLVLGSGGASATVVEALRDLGAREIVVVSRSGPDNYVNVYARHADADVVINATPLGMYPANGAKALELKHFPKLKGVLDVIYNPLRTALVMEAEDMGIPAGGGLYMLVAQAVRSAEIFLGKEFDESVVDEIAEDLSRKVENIIIIGMPGAGKSTIAARVAELSGRKLIETDDLIVEAAGCDIPSIFAEGGEAAFRALETEAIASCAKLSGLVISTGGGCVTIPDNYPLLHQNGRIYWLKRDLALLPKDGRPISLSRSAEDIYNDRKALYEAFADVEILNDSTIDAAAEAILNR